MEQLFISVIILLLATYGLVVLLKEFAYSYRIAKNNDGIRLVVLVKNREQDAEWILRKTLSEEGILIDKCKLPVLIVDMESNDDTQSILKSLAMEHEEFELVEYGNRNKIFEEV